jgi:DNA polymerase
MLASIALARDQVLLANIVPWRPPGGRDPAPRETAMCLPFVRRLIVLGRPREIVLLGGRVMAALIGDRLTSRRMAKPLGVAIDGLAEPVIAIPLPTLEQVAGGGTARRSAWQGLRALRRTIDSRKTEKVGED